MKPIQPNPIRKPKPVSPNVNVGEFREVFIIQQPNNEGDWVKCHEKPDMPHRCGGTCAALNDAYPVDIVEAVEFWGKHGWILLGDDDNFDDEYEGKHRSNGRGCVEGTCIHVIRFLNEIPPASNNLVHDYMLGHHP